jgi:hypothetical protein
MGMQSKMIEIVIDSYRFCKCLIFHLTTVLGRRWGAWRLVGNVVKIFVIKS